MSPQISIISPVYNTPESCFWRGVESVLSQTAGDYEYILVDDGSNEDCALRCDEAASRDDRIRVVHQANQGFAGAMNMGIDAAVGKYIMFFDPDDTMPDYVLEHALEIADEMGSDMVCSTSTLRYPDKDIVGSFDIGDERTKVLSPEEQDAYRVFCLTGMLPKGGPKWFGNGLRRGHVCKLIDRDLFYDVRLEPTMCAGSDSLMVAELLKRAHKVTLVNEIWYFYYMNSFSVTHTYNYEKDAKEFKAMQRQKAAYGADYDAARLARYCDTARRVSAAGFSAYKGLRKYLSAPEARETFDNFDPNRYEITGSRELAAKLGKAHLYSLLAFLYCAKSTIRPQTNKAFSA